MVDNLYIDNINLGSSITGIDVQDAANYSVLIFPNPANTAFTIEYLLSKTDNVSYEIMDITGRIITSSEAGKQPGGLHQVAFQTADFSGGMYYVKMKIGTEFITKKLLINK
jgi:hypothetical protein